jgi:hypothetical protein
MIQRDNGNYRWEIVSDRTEATMQRVLRKHIAKGSTIHHDGWASYLAINYG